MVASLVKAIVVVGNVILVADPGDDAVLDDHGGIVLWLAVAWDERLGVDDQVLRLGIAGLVIDGAVGWAANRDGRVCCAYSHCDKFQTHAQLTQRY
jgi:hypothetical protein